jgi:hypothetical protein
MTPDLQKFLDICKTIPEIINVTVEDPTDLMMAQVKGSFELSQLPVVVRFTIKDSAGNPQPVESVIPYEILNKFENLPVSELVNAADRHSVMPSTDALRFTRPDGSGSYPLAGHEWVEADIPELEGLLTKLKELPNVSDATIHNIVDPEIINQTEYDNAIRFIISIEDLTHAHLNDKDDYHHDHFRFILPKEIYLDESAHESIIANVATNVDTILSKCKLC